MPRVRRFGGLAAPMARLCRRAVILLATAGWATLGALGWATLGWGTAGWAEESAEPPGL